MHRSGVGGDDAGGGVDLVLGVQCTVLYCTVDLVLGVQPDLVVGLQQAEDRAAQEDHQLLLTSEFVVL